MGPKALSFAEPVPRRASSITFSTPHPIPASPTLSGAPRERTRSLSSPPPPPTFLKRVAFDTFDNPLATDYSLTLKSKHKDYLYSSRSRTFLCGTDQNEYSEFALEWLLDDLVEAGDEVICLRVVSPDTKMAGKIDRATQERLYQREAALLMEKVQEKNDDDKAISIIVEFAVGKVQDLIQRMIQIYEPNILIVGTRGKSMTAMSMPIRPKSISKYCLQHSPVPVIVVRPHAKREERMQKRLADHSRRLYHNMVEGGSGDVFPTGKRGSINPVTATLSALDLNPLAPVGVNEGGDGGDITPSSQESVKGENPFEAPKEGEAPKATNIKIYEAASEEVSPDISPDLEPVVVLASGRQTKGAGQVVNPAIIEYACSDSPPLKTIPPFAPPIGIPPKT